MFHMKHLRILIVGHCEAGCSTISSLYQRPVEAITLVVVAERITPAEIRDLSDILQIQIIRNRELFDFPVLEEKEIAKWPNDKLLVKRAMLNTKGFRRKRINPGRR